MNKIGFIGLGIMGNSMAGHLLSAGHEVSVFNRTASKCDELKAKGASVFDDAVLLLQNVDICCSCVTNSDALYSIIRRINKGMHVPKYWIDFSTIAPRAVVDLNFILKDFGCTFIDAPVTGGDVGARNATLAIMVGANEEDFSKIKPILEVLGKTIVRVGDVGRGQLTKCINQMMIAISIASMSEGMYFAESLGLDIDKTYQIVRSGSAGSWALENYFPRVQKDNYEPGFYARDMLKDLNFVLEEAKFLGVELPVTDLVRNLFESFVKGEGAELGNHALIKLYRLSDKS